jgi:CBS domain-containing protein
MFGHQERVTVRELMTRNPEAAPVGATVADVHDWLDDRGYTAAPLARDDPPYVYVARERLASVREDCGDDPVYEHADRIDLSTLLSPDLGFEDLLVELEAEPFYFVGWHGEVAGIVTRSDLNKPAAHAFLYTRIGELEMRLRDLVDAEANWQGTLSVLQRDGAGDDTEYDAVRDEFEAYADADLQLREIDYTTFWQLQQAARESDAVVDVLGYADGDDLAAVLDDVRELRNQVAHYGNVVHHMGTELLDSGRNVHELEATYAELAGLLDALADWADASGVDTTRRSHARADD